MTTGPARLEANVDHGNSSGYFVRVDVELPLDALYPQSLDGITRGWLGLSPDEADTLAGQLADMARRAREAARTPRNE